MADIFTSRMRNLCNSMTEAIIQASENEKEARTKCNISEDLAADVDQVHFINKLV